MFLLSREKACTPLIQLTCDMEGHLCDSGELILQESAIMEWPHCWIPRDHVCVHVDGCGGMKTTGQGVGCSVVLVFAF